MSVSKDALAEELIELLSALVSIPSPSGEEANVQQAIISWFSANGIEAFLEPALDGLSNVVAEIDGAGPGPVVWIGGHCDTVSPAPDYSFNPYAPFVKDGRLYGLGAMDMKAGLATAMHVFREFHRTRSEWTGKVIFCRARGRGSLFARLGRLCRHPAQDRRGHHLRTEPPAGKRRDRQGQCQGRGDGCFRPWVLPGRRGQCRRRGGTAAGAHRRHKTHPAPGPRRRQSLRP